MGCGLGEEYSKKVRMKMSENKWIGKMKDGKTNQKGNDIMKSGNLWEIDLSE